MHNMEAWVEWVDQNPVAQEWEAWMEAQEWAVEMGEAMAVEMGEAMAVAWEVVMVDGMAAVK